MTVGEVIDERGEKTQFFCEYIDTETKKCHGTKVFESHELERDRKLGFEGAKERTFVMPFELQRGHLLITTHASLSKPVWCTEIVHIIDV